MSTVSQDAQQQVFLNARTQNGWLDKPVSEEALHKIYDLMKWGPTSANCSPGRILFVNSKKEREKLLPCMIPGNVDKTRAAPVTAIIAQDIEFFEHLPKLFPHTDARSWFVDNKDLIQSTAFRNSTLQGAYFIIAARMVGLDCGPMSGFDAAKVDETFFSGTTWKTNFICNLGYGDPSKVFPRSPRLAFHEACKIV